MDENAAPVSRFSESTAAYMGMSPEDVVTAARGDKTIVFSESFLVED